MDTIDLDGLLDEFERQEDSVRETVQSAENMDTATKNLDISSTHIMQNIPNMSNEVKDQPLIVSDANHCAKVEAETVNFNAQNITHNVFMRQLSSPAENIAGMDLTVPGHKFSAALSSEDSCHSSAASCTSPNFIEQPKYVGPINGESGPEGFSDDSAICMADVMQQSNISHYNPLPPDVVLAGPDVVAGTVMDAEDGENNMDVSTLDIAHQSVHNMNEASIGGMPSNYPGLNCEINVDNEQNGNVCVPDIELHLESCTVQPDVASFTPLYASQPDVAAHSSAFVRPDLVGDSNMNWSAGLAAARHLNEVESLQSSAHSKHEYISFSGYDNDDENVPDAEVENYMQNSINSDQQIPCVPNVDDESNNHISHPVFEPIDNKLELLDSPSMFKTSTLSISSNELHSTNFENASIDEFTLKHSEENPDIIKTNIPPSNEMVGLQASETAVVNVILNLPEIQPVSSFQQESSNLSSIPIERRGSGLSLEKFLAPNIGSPFITTPAEDPGFAKIPGFEMKLSSTIEVKEEQLLSSSEQNLLSAPFVTMLHSEIENSQAEKSLSTIAVPCKDVPVKELMRSADAGSARRSRPNSLMGLSKPVLDLPADNAGTNSGPRSLPIFPTNYEASTSHTPVPVAKMISPTRDSSSSVIENFEFDPRLLLAAGSMVSTFEEHQFLHRETISTEQIGGSSLKLKRPTSLTLPSREDYQPQSKRSPSQEQLITPSQAASNVNTVTTIASQVGEMDTTEAPPSVLPSDSAPVIPPVRPRLGDASHMLSPPAPPLSSSNSLISIVDLGRVAPSWMPDAETVKCMQCDSKFTFTKRRHHCRACGKIYCNTCCNIKYKLIYMDNKEGRVCSRCYQDLLRAQAFERIYGSTVMSPHSAEAPLPGMPNLSATLASGSSATLPAGVLRKDGLTPTSSMKRDNKSVMFSDGIRPGGDLVEDSIAPVDHHVSTTKPAHKIVMVERKADDGSAVLRNIRPPHPLHLSFIPADGLPPVLLPNGRKIENAKPEDYVSYISDGCATTKPVTFLVNKNLQVLVKIVHLDCCVNRLCWCYVSEGLCSVAQDEVVIILECFPDEQVIPRDIFVHYQMIYEEAAKGNTLSPMSHSVFTQEFLGSKDHAGFLYITPSFQCLQKLPLPQSPFLVGLLLQKWEIPWAKIFPIRLMLRLGAEFRYYPCQLTSMRFRRPVYGEIGHTIMNVLADFRNFQYSLAVINGLTVQMEDKRTLVNIPRDKYNEIVKVVDSATDNVIAFGASFSQDADSHLVCVQNDEGVYQTQAINIQNLPRKVTGASFVIFNGSLKSAAGFKGKSSIIEDGLMVQVSAETLSQLLVAFKEMKDFSISCGNVSGTATVSEEMVLVSWVDSDVSVNVGVKSNIDGIPLDGIKSVRIHNFTDYLGETKYIRWTEVFLIELNQTESRGEPLDVSKLCEGIARACCIALAPNLDVLVSYGQKQLGLRIHISTEKVEYEIGSNGSKLPDVCSASLDEELVPALHSLTSSNREGPISVELVFHIVN